MLFHFGRIVSLRSAPFHNTLSRHGITRSNSVLRMAYRKRCVFSTCCCSCFPMAAGCSESSQTILVVPFLGRSHPLNVNLGVENANLGVENKNILRNFSLIHKIVVNLCRTVKARPQSCRETSSFHYDRVGSLRRTKCSESPRG